MKEKVVAKRYAEAFLSYAKPAIGLEKAVEELGSLKILLRENPEFQEFFDNPKIIFDEKCRIIDATLHDFSDESRQFLKLLIEKDRIDIIIEICDYVRVNYSRSAAFDALLKTTYPLELDLIQAIKKKLEDKFKRKLNLHLEFDANLLGGIQVRVGNSIIDSSTRRRLDELRAKLLMVKVN